MTAIAPPGAAQVAPQALHMLSPERRVGPIPDYSRVAGIATHRQLQLFSPNVAEHLDRLLDAAHVVEYAEPGALEEADSSLLWMRDYAPLYVTRADGSLVEIRYLSENPNRSQYALQATHERTGPLPVEHLPILHENGNLLVAGRWIFTSTRVLRDNAHPRREPHLEKGGYKPRAAHEVVSLIAAATRRSPGDIVLLDPMPEEATQHVDVFLLPLGDDVVAVPELRKTAIEVLPDPVDRGLAARTRRFLDDTAGTIERLGLRVIRLPMLAPRFLPDVETPEHDISPLFYTPANSLLVHTMEQRVALMPVVDDHDLTLPERSMVGTYQREWVEKMRAEGWAVHLVDATDLAPYLGLLRCATSPIPLP